MFLVSAILVVIRLCGFFSLCRLDTRFQRIVCAFNLFGSRIFFFQNYLCCLKRCLQRCIICRCIVVRIYLFALCDQSFQRFLIRRLAQICHRYGQFGRNAVHFFLRRVRIVQNPLGRIQRVSKGLFDFFAALIAVQVCKNLIALCDQRFQCAGVCPHRQALDCITQSLLRRLYLHLESIFVVYQPFCVRFCLFIDTPAVRREVFLIQFRQAIQQRLQALSVSCGKGQVEHGIRHVQPCFIDLVLQCGSVRLYLDCRLIGLVKELLRAWHHRRVLVAFHSLFCTLDRVSQQKLVDNRALELHRSLRIRHI